MIHRTAPSWQRIDAKIETKSPDLDDNTIIAPTNGWQSALQQSITDPKILFELLDLDQRWLPAAIKACALFPLRVPLSFIARMKKGDITDPLLQQVLPIAKEHNKVTGYIIDPVGEQKNATKGIIQKYHGRVLLMVNGHCAVNCRYCFRRHFPYENNRMNRKDWIQSLATIAADTSINEVIYSGGDPLASNDKQLTWLTEQLLTIPHIQRLRIHSRLPVVIPERITTESLRWMSEHRLNTVMVLHINHPNELNDDHLLSAIRQMKKAGITVLNQTVLLKGVNDSIDCLTSLSERLFEAGVLPYYLHLLDKVSGAAHFDLPVSEAKNLHKGMTEQLSGYLVPKLVNEVAGHPSKTPIQY